MLVRRIQSSQFSPCQSLEKGWRHSAYGPLSPSRSVGPVSSADRIHKRDNRQSPSAHQHSIRQEVYRRTKWCDLARASLNRLDSRGTMQRTITTRITPRLNAACPVSIRTYLESPTARGATLTFQAVETGAGQTDEHSNDAPALIIVRRTWYCRSGVASDPAC